MIKQLAKYMGKYWKYAIFTPIIVFIETIGELIMPKLMANIVDTGIANGIAGTGNGLIIRYGLLMVVVALVCAALGVIGSKFSSTASQGYGSNLRVAIYHKIQDFSFADVDRFSTASLITRLTGDVRMIQMVFMQTMRVLVKAPSMMIIALIIVLGYNAKLAIIYLIAVPILFVVVTVLMKITHHMFRVMQEKMDGLNSAVQENLIAIRVVKTFVRRDFEKEKFRKANDELTRNSIRAMALMMLTNPCSTLILNLATVAVYWFGGKMVGHGLLLSGELMAVITYLSQIMMSVMMFSHILQHLNRARACGERIVEVLNAVPDIIGGQQGEGSGETGVSGNVEFKNVSFKYKATGTGEDVLHGISFKVSAGETVAIIGGTGSGKSSLVNLIPRFYDATSGDVLVNGVNVRDYDLTVLREHIGMVLQKNVLFSGTIRDNMRWGDENATDEEICTALRNAQAYDFVMGFPNGLDTMLKQGGSNVSGGQRQRLCIARAMLKKPSILILDDSTSAVDSETESRIRETFNTELSGCTVFIIAQRISSVSGADKIIVLDGGEVESIGNHESLMEISPIYRDIYLSQKEGGKLTNG